MPTLTPEIIRAAIRGFELQIEELRALLPSTIKGELGPPTPIAAVPGKKKRNVSAAGRKRMAEAQKKRWAAYYAKHPKKKSA